jgi:hypothetical protein
LPLDLTAKFAPGSDSAYVSILPRNDNQLEWPETVMLTLRPGTEYGLGAATSAGITIQDATRQDAYGRTTRGVFGSLAEICGLLSTSQGVHNLEIFVDTDQSRTTGETRRGHVGGAEFWISSLYGAVNWFWTAIAVWRRDCV